MDKHLKIHRSDGPLAFDAALRLARNPGDVIELVNVDQVETMGPWAFPEHNYRSIGRCKIDAGQTRIVLSPNATRKTLSAGNLVDRPDRDLPIAFAERDARIEGGVWDCNEAAFRNPDPAKCWFTSGIRFEDGGDYQALGLEVVGIRGTYRDRGAKTFNADVEVFAISSNGLPGINHDVRECIVQGCADDSYCSGIMSGGSVRIPSMAISAHTQRIGSVVNCRVDLGSKNWFAFSSNVQTEDPNLGLFVEFFDCKGKGVQRGFHNDTGGTMARLTNVDLESSWSDISLAGGLPSDRRTVLVDNCTLRAATTIDLAQIAGEATVVVRRSRVSAATRHGSISGGGAIMFDRASLGERPAVWQIFNGARQPIVLPD